MGVRKILTRVCNVIYLAGAGFAVYSLLTQPLLTLSVNATIDKDTLGETLEGALNKGDAQPASVYTPDTRNRDGGNEGGGFDPSSMFTKETISAAIGDLEISLKFEIPAKYFFDLENKDVLNTLIIDNIDTFLTSTVNTFVPKLTNLVKEVASSAASEIMADSISTMITETFGGDGTQVSSEDVKEIFDNVFNVLDKEPGETTSVEEITEALLGTVNYTQVTENKEADFSKYFVLEGEDYVKASDKGSYDPSGTYYIEEYGAGIYSVLQDNGVEFSAGDIDTSSIEDTLIDALSNMPGLTTQNYIEVTESNPDDFENYYIKVGEEYVKASENDGTYDPSTTYYVAETVITNLNDALLALLDQFAGGAEPAGASRTPIKRDAPATQGDDDLTEKVKDLLNGFIPLEDIKSVDLSFGGLAPIVLLGLVVLAALPWLLFALVTLIRTLRPRKCWTKPWIVFVFAFIEVILGAGLTFFFLYGFEALKPTLLGLIPPTEGLDVASLLGNLSIGFQMGVFYPSLVYLAMIPFTIFYIIVAHGPKKEFKEFKKQKKEEKKAAKLAKKAA